MLHRLILWWPRPAEPGRAPDGLRAVPAFGAGPWLALLALSTWPHARWAWARLRDGSDEPLGIAAAAVLAWALWRMRRELRPQPLAGWQMLSCGLALLAAAAHLLAPPLVGAGLAVLALAAGLRALLPAGRPWLPLLGLGLLSLPLIASMQFYAGFPLRVVTAQASAWLLRAGGWLVERSGTALTVDGQLVIVDAPCSGVQMVWLSYFAACATAWWRGVPDRAFLRRVAGVGLLVLLGNTLRNSVLVALEVASPPWADRLHQAVGLVVQAAVCLAVVVWMSRRFVQPAVPARWAGTPRLSTWTQAIACLSLLACAVLPLLAGARTDTPPMPAEAEWPTTWDGRPLRPLAPTAAERRAEQGFPGRIQRLTDGRSVLMWRSVSRVTRSLHSPADCYRALGYSVAPARLERDAHDRLWRCFVAQRQGSRLNVCERIEDRAGRAWTDASAWYWAAALGSSTGPWRAITTATPL